MSDRETTEEKQQKAKDEQFLRKNERYRSIAKWSWIGFVGVVLSLLMWRGHLLGDCSSDPLTLNDYLGRLLSAFSLFGFGWLIVSISHKWMQNRLFVICCFLVLFVSGVLVYSKEGISYDVWFADLLSPMNSTLSIFFPSRGGYEKEFSSIALGYTLLHLLSYLYIAMLGVSLFGRRMMNRTAGLMLLARHKNIFWGYSDGGVLLAKDIKQRTILEKAIFVMPENMPLSREVEQYRFEEIDGIEGIVLYKDFSKEIDIKASRHFFLTEDQDLNVKLAFMVLDGIGERSKFKSCKCKLYVKSKLKWIVKKIFKRECKFTTKFTIKLYVRTELDHVDKYFTQKLKYIYELNKDVQVEVHTINESELTARRFIDKYSPLDMPKVIRERKIKDTNKKFSILQLGYGWSGKAVLDKLICNTQFEDWEFSATVFDRDLRTKHGFYPLLDKECIDTDNENAVNYYNITTNPTDVNGCTIEVGSERFKDWVIGNISKFNRIIVALGDDTFNVHIALSIANILNQKYKIPPEESSKYVFAHIRDADCYTYFDMEITPISVFGNKDRIYTMGIIINDELDKLAKLMNFLYCNLKTDEEFGQLIERLASEKINIATEKESYWSTASILNQDSSRAAAASIDNTLRLNNLQRVRKINADDKGVPFCFDTNIEKGKDEMLERLAENEHRRWNAFHFTRGIKYWDVLSGVKLSDFGGDKPKPNRIGKTNSHAALVAYGDLDTKVDAVFNPMIKEYYGYNEEKYEKYKISMKENDRKLIKGIAGILAAIDYKIVEIEKK